MYPNFLFIPTLLGAALLCGLGLKTSSGIRSTFALSLCYAAAVILALPALLFVACYAHILDKAVWFYAFRAMPYSELSALGLGFGLGLLLGYLKRWEAPKSPILSKLAVACCGLILMVPYVKPILAPLRVTPQNHWAGNVALQTTLSTCGPCAANTLLHQFHIAATENELARECFTYRGGTENWYVARALQKRGLQTHYFIDPPQTSVLRFPSIAGVQSAHFKRGGHFIAIMGRQGNRYVVGDPLIGKLVLTPEQLHSRYYFTGFFLVVDRPQNGHLPV